MASLIFNGAFDDALRGNINFASDTFKALLVTASYTPDKDTHARRSDVTNEVTGTGYTSGGTAVTATVAKDNATDRVTVTFSNPSWSAATITARAAVIYKSRGGASSADELVGYLDFGSNITSSAGTFAVSITTPLTLQN